MSLCNTNWKDLLSGDTHPKPDIEFLVVGVDGQRLFPAHQYLLAIVSPVFKEQFYEKAQEGMDKNVGNGSLLRITLDTSPSAAEAFFKYIYEKMIGKVSFHDWFELWKLSERYQMEKLSIDVKEAIAKFIVDNSEEAVEEIWKMKAERNTKEIRHNEVDNVVKDLKEKLCKSDETKNSLRKIRKVLRKKLEEKNAELCVVLARKTSLEKVQEQLKRNNEELLNDQKALIEEKENLVKESKALFVQNMEIKKEAELLDGKCDKLAQEIDQLMEESDKTKTWIAEKEERAKKVLTNAKAKIQKVEMQNVELRRKLAAKGLEDSQYQVGQAEEMDAVKAAFGAQINALKISKEKSEEPKSEVIKEKEKLIGEVEKLKQELTRIMEDTVKMKEVSNNSTSTISDSSIAIKTELLEVKTENVFERREYSNYIEKNKEKGHNDGIVVVAEALELKNKILKVRVEELQQEYKNSKASAGENFRKALGASNAKIKSSNAKIKTLNDEKKQIEEEMETMKDAFGTQIDFLKKEHHKVLVQLSNSIEKSSTDIPSKPPAFVVPPSAIVSSALSSSTSTMSLPIIQGTTRNVLEDPRKDPSAAIEAAIMEIKEIWEKREAAMAMLDTQKRESSQLRDSSPRARAYGEMRPSPSPNRSARASLSPHRSANVKTNVIRCKDDCLSFDLSDEESEDLRMSLDQRKIEDEESEDLRMALDQRKTRRVVMDANGKDPSNAIMGENKSPESQKHAMDTTASNKTRNKYFNVKEFNTVKEFTSPRKRLSPFRRQKVADRNPINVSMYEEEDGEYVESEVAKQEAEDVRKIHVTVPNHQDDGDNDAPNPDHANGNKKRHRVRCQERKNSIHADKKIKNNDKTAEINQGDTKDATNENSEKEKEVSLDNLVIRNNAYGSKSNEAKKR